VIPRAVIVHRPTPYQELIGRHGTAGQAAFFLRTRGQDIDPLAAAHQRQARALDAAMAAVPQRWRRSRVDRADLDRFLFEPEDVVIAVGQDGLVANVAKYLDGQRVIGVNPDPSRFDGVLVKHSPRAVAALVEGALDPAAAVEARTMVEVRLRDGQRLCALNEIFLGHISHQSARYHLRAGRRAERHSSSGVVIATGTGATGWARSIHLSRQSGLSLPAPTEAALVFFAREAFPSRATGTALTEGRVDGAGALEVTSEMDSGGVLFGDGIEADRLEFPWGEVASIGCARRTLNLLLGPGAGPGRGAPVHR